MFEPSVILSNPSLRCYAQPMQVQLAQNNRKGGFALIVVLTSLVVVTALFMTAQARTLGRLRDISAERALIENGQIERDLLDVAAALLATARVTRPEDYIVSVGGHDFDLRFQHVSGLIDLNSASPALLQRLSDHLGLPPDALRRYRAWRQTPHRLLRVQDFLRITGANSNLRGKIESVATVHSGQSAFLPSTAPPAIMARSDSVGAGEHASDDQNDPTAANYRVAAKYLGTRSEVALGVIHVAPNAALSRVLQMF